MSFHFSYRFTISSGTLSNCLSTRRCSSMRHTCYMIAISFMACQVVYVHSPQHLLCIALSGHVTSFGYPASSSSSVTARIASRQTAHSGPLSGTATKPPTSTGRWHRTHVTLLGANGLALPDDVSAVVISSSRMSSHRSTHSSQMYTFGPAIRFRTSDRLLEQNEQCRFSWALSCVASCTFFLKIPIRNVWLRDCWLVYRPRRKQIGVSNNFTSRTQPVFARPSCRHTSTV